MRRNSAVTSAERGLSLPRGWIILGLALMSWAVVVGLWTGISQLFFFVMGS